MRIVNQAAIVTGGACGLGLATGETLAAAGARVALLDIDAARVAAAAARIGSIGLQCDVGDAAIAEHALAEARQAHGPAAILVNCAGIAAAKRIVGRDGPMQLSEFELVIRVNLIGTFNLMHLAPAEIVPFPKRLGRPEEYAQLVRQILDNPMLNGETIRLDGAIRLAPQ